MPSIVSEGRQLPCIVPANTGRHKPNAHHRLQLTATIPFSLPCQHCRQLSYNLRHRKRAVCRDHECAFDAARPSAVFAGAACTSQPVWRSHYQHTRNDSAGSQDAEPAPRGTSSAFATAHAASSMLPQPAALTACSAAVAAARVAHAVSSMRVARRGCSSPRTPRAMR
eukprot:6187583-Pleurochrysis_carterae.AAC.1